MKEKSGFTLLELMVVVIIIIILAAIALPRFLGGLERSRIAEASNFMQSVRERENVWLSTHSSATQSFTDLGFVTGSGITISPATTATGKYFTFLIGTDGTVQAKRNLVGTAAYNNNTFTLEQNGTWGNVATGGLTAGTVHPLRPTNE